jgi:hypothetical protein
MNAPRADLIPNPVGPFPRSLSRFRRYPSHNHSLFLNRASSRFNLSQFLSLGRH